jgi:hypothetical protein
MSEMSTTSWTSDIDAILEKIRLNCVEMSKQHKSKYFYLKHVLQYFKLPIIIVSAFNSAFSVCLQPYTEQQNISIINCSLALLCSIIGSIEIYLGLSKGVEDEILISKEYYLLSINIYKVLSLEVNNRPSDSRIILEGFWNDYSALIDKSRLLNIKVSDSLQPLPTYLVRSNSQSPRKQSGDIGFHIDIPDNV